MSNKIEINKFLLHKDVPCNVCHSKNDIKELKISDHITALCKDCRKKLIKELENEMNIKTKEIYIKAMDEWGIAAQICMTFEEMAELQKELCKNLRGKENTTNIAEEIADVKIMIEQIEQYYEIENQVEKFREYKIERLEERLKLELINSMEFIDWSCGGGECEYVLVEDNKKNRETLHEIGLTDKDIENECYPEEGALEISQIAWKNTSANYYNGKERRFH